MSLILFFHTLRSQWLSLVFLVVIGSGIGYVSSLMITPQWEAESVLVPTLLSLKDNETGVDMVSRLRSPLALRRVADRVVLEQPGFNIETLRGGTRIVPYGSGATLKVRANSSELAIRISEYFLDEFNRQQDALLAVRQDQLKARKLLIQREYGELLKALPDTEGMRGKSAVTLLLGINGQDLIQGLLPSPASFSIAPACLEKPVTPSRLLISILGASIGLCLAMTRALLESNKRNI